jgi:hypothetical protein
MMKCFGVLCAAVLLNILSTSDAFSFTPLSRVSLMNHPAAKQLRFPNQMFRNGQITIKQSRLHMTLSEPTTASEESIFTKPSPPSGPNTPPYTLSPQQTAYVWLTR